MRELEAELQYKISQILGTKELLICELKKPVHKLKEKIVTMEFWIRGLIQGENKWGK